MLVNCILSLLDNSCRTYSPFSEIALRKLLTTSTHAVIFLSSNLEILHINKQAQEKFSTENIDDKKFLTFSRLNNIDHIYHFSKNIQPPIESMLKKNYLYQRI